MKIILVRHYKVDIKKLSSLTSDEYDKYCTDYNDSPIINQVPPKLPNFRLYSSNMSRAKETARLATGREPELLKGVYEVTFRSHKKTNKKLKFNYFELMARLQWFFNNSRQSETRSMTLARLEKAANLLINRNENCIVVMHSFVMRILSRLLIKKGFKGKKIYLPKNGQAFLFEK